MQITNIFEIKIYSFACEINLIFKRDTCENLKELITKL